LTNLFLEELRALLGTQHVSTDTEARLRASASWSPVFQKRKQRAQESGDLLAGTVAAVVQPGTTDEVAAVVRGANRTGTPLFPVGGASNLTNDTTTRPPGIAVDLSRLNSVQWEEESLTVTVGAGAVCQMVEEQLARHSYTLGNLPQSSGLLTVGGAIATNAVGLFSGRYGRQADGTIALEAVLPSGEIVRTNDAPGANAAFDFLRLLVGSEGQFGIITSATLRMYPMPDVRAFAVFTFADFTEGMDAARLIYRSDARPAAVRVFDRDAAEVYLPNTPCLLIAAFEGEELVQTGQYQLAHAVCQRIGGTEQPPEIGDAWFESRTKTDWFSANARPAGLADVFAVSASWSNIKTAAREMRSALAPLVTHLAVHLSHPTPHGAALEVYWQSQAEPATADAALALYERIHHAGMTACLESGGSIAHHLGIGSVRLPYRAKERGPEGIAAWKSIKTALDPNHVLNPGFF
jgi:alkyldihydroxyacetonephosphate synthase